MNIHYYVSSGNFDEFCKTLANCDDLISKDSQGKTILHLIASKKEEAFLKTLFSKKSKSNYDYISVYEARLREKNLDMRTALSIQDNNGNTPIHEALVFDNWNVAQHFSRFMGYETHSPNYFRNLFGLTEYEYALVLYGLNSRKEEMRSLFKYEKYNSEISKQSLLEIKKATKAFKFIDLENKRFSGLLTSDDPIFKKARENDYPSSLSTFDEDYDLAEFCKKLGLPAHDYIIERKWPLISVDDLLVMSKIPKDEKVRFYSFLCEFYAFTCYQVSDQPNMRNMAITVTCDATNQVGITESEARWLEACISRFIGTRSPSRQEAYRPYVERIYTRNGLKVLDS